MGLMEATDDRFLGGRVLVRQPARGFRSGLDAVMLAAAVPARATDTVLELGSGAGVGSLFHAAPVGGVVSGAEIAPELTGLANENARDNGVGERVEFICADALNLPPNLRIEFDHVFCNPPFHGENGERSPDAARARATHYASLADWLQSGWRRTASGGTFTAILRADRLGEALLTLGSGGVLLFPLWPRADEPAKRVIVQARKGSHVPLQLLPGLVLHSNDGRYTPEADAILRDGAALVMDQSRR
jgi:tRNA1(Val) A37 N6-methylase TrmN6